MFFEVFKKYKISHVFSAKISTSRKKQKSDTLKRPIYGLFKN